MFSYPVEGQVFPKSRAFYSPLDPFSDCPLKPAAIQGKSRRFRLVLQLVKGTTEGFFRFSARSRFSARISPHLEAQNPETPEQNPLHELFRKVCSSFCLLELVCFGWIFFGRGDGLLGGGRRVKQARFSKLAFLQPPTLSCPKPPEPSVSGNRFSHKNRPNFFTENIVRTGRTWGGATESIVILRLPLFGGGSQDNQTLGKTARQVPLSHPFLCALVKTRT